MFDNHAFYGDIVRGDLHAAVDYLKAFPSKRRTLKRYMKTFEKPQPINHSKNPVINRVCQIFDTYYHMVFWLKEDHLKSIQYLCDAFSSYLNMPSQVYTSLQEAEDNFNKIERNVAKLV